MEPIRFAGEIRYWSAEKQGGLAVVDVPTALVAALGGLKQQRVHGTIDGAPFTSSVMPSGGGRLSLSVSKAMRAAAKAAVGSTVEVHLERVGKD